jgi:phage terminase small subunit
MTDREKAKNEYLKGKSLKDIADGLGIKYDTVRQWKARDKWPTVVTNKRHIKSKGDSVTKSAVITVPLNDRQQLFCEIYVRNFNATQSYLKAYECDYNTARTNGCLLLTKPNIRAYIQSLKEVKKQSIMINVDDVVELYMRIAFSDITNFVEFGSFDAVTIVDGVLVMDSNGDPVMHKESGLRLKQDDEVDGSLISEISTSKQGSKIKLEDKHKALAWLTNYFMANPLDQHKISYDSAKQELDRLEYERRKKADEDW